jgi:hypothetical protein
MSLTSAGRKRIEPRREVPGQGRRAAGVKLSSRTRTVNWTLAAWAPEQPAPPPELHLLNELPRTDLRPLRHEDPSNLDAASANRRATGSLVSASTATTAPTIRFEVRHLDVEPVPLDAFHYPHQRKRGFDPTFNFFGGPAIV